MRGSLLKLLEKSKKIVAISVIYLFAWWPSLLFLDAVYWDDWLYLNNPTALQKHFSEAGFPWIGWINTKLFFFIPHLYHAASFLSFLIAAVMLIKILEKPGLERLIPNSFDRTVTAILFSILPINFARHSMNVVLYAICYLLFFVCWFLMIRDLTLAKKQKIIVILLAIICFNLNSLLVFFLIPVTHRIWILRQSRSVPLITIIKSEAWLIIIPFVWFLIKFIFFRPYGLYVGYNSLSLIRLLLLTLACLLISIIVWGCFYKDARRELGEKQKLLFFGFVCIFLAIAPYWIVGKPLYVREWESRNYILLPLGLSMIIFLLIKTLALSINYKAGYYVAVFTILSCITLVTSHKNIEFFRDWQKQQVLLDWFGDNIIANEPTLIIVNDNTENLNAMQRDYRFYEWIGMLKFKDKKSSFLIGSREFYSERVLLTEGSRLIKLTNDTEYFFKVSNWDYTKEVSTLGSLEIYYDCKSPDFFDLYINTGCFRFEYERSNL
jgi:hypothetical protein